MFSREKKQELKSMIVKANEILKEYYLMLEYCQYSYDASEGMVPSLVCSIHDFDKVQKGITKIGLEVLEEGEDNLCKLAFYVSSVNYDSKDLQESIEKMNVFQKTLADVKELNNIGLWASGDLRTLYS
jgi:protein involved in sex pheromone biosynthesis